MSDFLSPLEQPNNPKAAAMYYARKRNRSASLASPTDDLSSKARGSIAFTTNAVQTITLGGTVVTFGTGFALGADLATTLANLLTYLNASADANIAKAAYQVSATALQIKAKATGVATFTLAASAGTVSHGTLQLAQTHKRAA